MLKATRSSLFYSLFIFILYCPFLAETSSSSDPGDFSNPPKGNTGNSDYTDDKVWIVGETQTITFNTSYSEFTIALWQQDLPGGSATLGPIIYETTTGAVAEFDWVVQVFDFNLSSSNVFFLWLHQGDSSRQGAGDGKATASHYVNFTNSDDQKASSDSISSSSDTSLSSSVSSPSSLSSSASAPSTATSTTSSAESSRQSSVKTSGNGLSTGAKAGIGIGTSLAGLAVIAAGLSLILVHRRRRIVQRPKDGLFLVGEHALDQDIKTGTEPSSSSSSSKDHKSLSSKRTSDWHSTEPTELHGDSLAFRVAELDAT